jgi:hypothetical protein
MIRGRKKGREGRGGRAGGCIITYYLDTQYKNTLK